MTELSLERSDLLERYLDAIRDKVADEFLDELDDDDREWLLAMVLEESGHGDA